MFPGRPVKWVATREEDFTSSLIAHGIRSVMKMGAKKDGTLVAFKATIYHTGGAYADTPVNVTMASTHNSTGPYEFKHCRPNRIHCLHQYSGSRCLSWLWTSGITAWIRAYDRTHGSQVEDGSIRSAQEELSRTRQNERHGRDDVRITMGICAAVPIRCRNAVFSTPKLKEDNDYYYGRGFAAVFKSPKGAPFSTKGCYMKMNIDGSVNINMGGAEVGQGLRTVIRQVAAEALQIPPEKIRVYTEIDTQYSPYEWQTIGSMFTTQGGRAIIRAAKKLIALLKSTAAQVLKTDEDYLTYDGEFIYLTNDPRIRVAVGDLARGYITERRNHHWRSRTIHIRRPFAALLQPGQEWSGKHRRGIHIRGHRRPRSASKRKPARSLVDRFVSTFDVGQVINPLQIRGSVLGGVTMAIGAALYEELNFDEQGRITNPQLFKYHIPTYKEAAETGRSISWKIREPSDHLVHAE